MLLSFILSHMKAPTIRHGVTGMSLLALTTGVVYQIRASRANEELNKRLENIERGTSNLNSKVDKLDSQVKNLDSKVNNGLDMQNQLDKK